MRSILSKISFKFNIFIQVNPFAPPIFFSFFKLSLIFKCLPPSVILIIDKLASINKFIIDIELYTKSLSFESIDSACKYFLISKIIDFYIAFVFRKIFNYTIGFYNKIIIFLSTVDGKLIIMNLF